MAAAEICMALDAEVCIIGAGPPLPCAGRASVSHAGYVVESTDHAGGSRQRTSSPSSSRLRLNGLCGIVSVLSTHGGNAAKKWVTLRGHDGPEKCSLDGTFSHHGQKPCAAINVAER